MVRRSTLASAPPSRSERPVEQVHGGDLYRYWRISLMRRGGRHQAQQEADQEQRGEVSKTASSHSPSTTPDGDADAAERPMPRRRPRRAGVSSPAEGRRDGPDGGDRFVRAHQRGAHHEAHLGYAANSSPLMPSVGAPRVHRPEDRGAAPDEARWTGYTGVIIASRAGCASKRSRAESRTTSATPLRLPVGAGNALIGGLVLLLAVPPRRPGWKSV